MFIRILKVLIKHWCSLGMCIFAYIDDGFGGGGPLMKPESLEEL